MSQLIKYEAACRALAECKAVDEVKAWADKAAAMQAYGRMAKDKTLEVDASEIRIRAERRLGEMLTAQKQGGGLAAGTRGQLAGKSGDGLAVVSNDRQKHAPKLADAGISKDLSSRAQKLAAVPESEFEAEVGAWRERVSIEGARVSARLEAAGEREQKKKRQLHQPEAAPSAEDEATEARHAIEELAAENERLSDRLAVEAMDASEEEKTAASQTIAELRERVRVLEIEVSALKASRDTYMRESSEKQKQISYWRKLAEKAAA